MTEESDEESTDGTFSDSSFLFENGLFVAWLVRW